MDPGFLWKKELRTKGYEYRASARSVRKLGRFSRVWHRILKLSDMGPRTKRRTVFEVGCGGGIHLVQFALQGWNCFGLDVSSEVLDRAKRFIGEIEQYAGRKLSIHLYTGDIIDFEVGSFEKSDLVFHVGVLEHFLDDAQRLLALKKMFAFAKPGGYVVSVVPNGMHPWRKPMKEQRLGGYNIPEIDYTNVLMEHEFKECGATDIVILPHNLFDYMRLKKNFLFKIVYYFAQTVPLSWIPKSFAFRHSGTIIGIARRIS